MIGNKNCVGRVFHQTAESRRKLSENTRGAQHWRWIADRSKLKICRDGRNKAARDWSNTVRMRDGWLCQTPDENCNKPIEAHHILRWHDYPDQRFEIRNGITLCHFHHPRGRADEDRLSPLFQNLVDLKMQ